MGNAVKLAQPPGQVTYFGQGWSLIAIFMPIMAVLIQLDCDIQKYIIIWEA